MDFSPTKRGVHLRLTLVHYSGREGKRSPERNLNNQNGFSFVIVACLFIYLSICTKALDKEVGTNAERKGPKDCLKEI